MPKDLSTLGTVLDLLAPSPTQNAPGSRTFTDPTHGWTVRYPSSWYVHPYALSSNGLAAQGAVFANVQWEWGTPTLTQHNYSMPWVDANFPPEADVILVQVASPQGRSCPMPDFSATGVQDIGPSNAGGERFCHDGITYTINYVTGTSAQGLDQLQQLISSLAFVSATPAGWPHTSLQYSLSFASPPKWSVSWSHTAAAPGTRWIAAVASAP